MQIVPTNFEAYSFQTIAAAHPSVLYIKQSEVPEDQWWIDAGKGFVEKNENRKALYCFGAISDRATRVYNCVQALRDLSKEDALKVALHGVIETDETETSGKDLGLLYGALGHAYLVNHLWKPAVASFEASTAYDHTSPQAWADLAFSYQMVSRFEDAVHAYKRAVILDPLRVELRTWLAMSQMLLRQWDEGLMNYEVRLLHANPMPMGRGRLWTGEDLEGATICLFQEQGFGDLVQFIRYVKVIREVYHARKVLLVCGDQAYRLMRRVDGIDEIYTTGMDLPRYDYQVALMSIPWIIHRTKAGCVRRWEYFWSNYGPYLNVERASRRYDSALDSMNPFTVGVCWRGNRAHKKDHLRSLGLDHTKDLLDRIGRKARLVSLQYDMTPEEKALDPKMQTPEFGDLLVLAEIIVGLDTVVTVDTLIAHLAGALGVPCKVLLQSDADWRHGASGERSVWYDSLDLRRATEPLKWGPAIQKLTEAL
jgi:tetratricopeptide (TPR) repeat protein